MKSIRLGIAGALFMSLGVFLYAQEAGREAAAGQEAGAPNQQEPTKPHEMTPPPQPPEVNPRSGQEETKPSKQEPEAKPSKTEEKRSEKEQAKPGHEEKGMSTEHQHGRPAGKSAHIPDPKFKANFGKQHTFTVNRVITTTTIVPNQTQFLFGGFTFIFLDPWPADWLLTDECFIDQVGEEVFLVNALHPGVRVALFVVG